MRRTRNHAAIMVKKNVTSKDRPVRTTGADMNDNVNESQLSAPEKIKSLRNYSLEHGHAKLYKAVKRNYHKPCQNQRGRISATNRKNGEIPEVS